MLIGINFFTKLIKYNLSIEQFCICYLIFEKNFTLVTQYLEKFGSFKKSDLDYLLESEYITTLNGSYDLDKLNVSPKFLDILKDSKEVTNDDWIDEWYDIFPKGIKSGNYAVRTDKPSCSKKLNKFMLLYPKFTKEIVLQATKNYVNEFGMKGYNYMKLAPYFIEKDGTSTLWGYCNSIIEGEVKNDVRGDMIDDI